MNLIQRLNALCDASRQMSHIEWYTAGGGPEAQTHAYLNEALKSTQSEEERWELFLDVLSC